MTFNNQTISTSITCVSVLVSSLVNIQKQNMTNNFHVRVKTEKKRNIRLFENVITRLQKIINKLINPNQSAYIKGRYIGSNARLILDIYEYCENFDNDGILLFLDFEKAFDSVEWNFLYKTLENFNFGTNFIKWMKILYTNPIFRTKNNGWLSKTVNMQRGIRQGCPVSALLYILVSEILAIKIKENINTQGFSLPNMLSEIKSVQHADDLTMINIESLIHGIETIKRFCLHAGSKINISKTECIFDNIDDIKVNTSSIKCLGIYVYWSRQRRMLQQKLDESIW